MAGFPVSFTQLIKKKRDGEELNNDEIEYIIKCIVGGKAEDSQIGALLMAMFLQGISDTEVVHLTRSMVTSGLQLRWDSSWNSLLVDKHSTGGVGDKISLILAPVLAACGLKVPMISGRSLAHTGGTLDKLESIPGFTVGLNEETMTKTLTDVGFFIAAATNQLCPADKILYRMRNVTCTIDSMNLIVSSIISKKASSGVKFLVIDVKVGKAAFCKDIESAQALAKQLIRVSRELGVRTRVVLSRMDLPIGNSAGNALEVVETVQCLKGNMPEDIFQLISTLGSNLLEMIDYDGDSEQLIKKVIENGSALKKFQSMLLAQGVSESIAKGIISGEPVLPTSQYSTDVKVFETSGWISNINAMILGEVCSELGATSQAGAGIDYSVGVVLHRHVGDHVETGTTWLTVYHSSPLGQHTLDHLQRAITISNTPVDRPNIILQVIK